MRLLLAGLGLLGVGYVVKRALDAERAEQRRVAEMRRQTLDGFAAMNEIAALRRTTREIERRAAETIDLHRLQQALSETRNDLAALTQRAYQDSTRIAAIEQRIAAMEVARAKAAATTRIKANPTPRGGSFDPISGLFN